VAPPIEPDPPEALKVVPAVTLIATDSFPNTIMLTISGGTPPYQSTSSDREIGCNDISGNGLCDLADPVLWNGSPIKVTIDSSSIGDDTFVDIDVFDSDAGTVKATINIIFADPVCGNGVLQFGEGCDDGNLDIDDGCDANCKIEP
jgi:cysteine-rich repeat protein